MRTLTLTLLIGCAAEPSPLLSSGDTGESSLNAERYSFPSRFDGEESVATTGQVFRQVLISDLDTHMGGLTERLNVGWSPVAGELAEELDFYFRFDSDTSGQVPLLFETSLPATQSVYDDLSQGKDLVGKLAGNDPVGQHKDWHTALAGWPGVSSPEELVESWFDELDQAGVAWSVGEVPLDPSGEPVPRVTLTADGRDLAELTSKFLLGAVAFSQGTDDYLDDTEPGKGLLSDHTEAEEGENYTALEHAWDEGFGYFGAARGYGAWSDEEIKAAQLDDNGDGQLDLKTEVCYGASVNAAKRDLGGSTDLTAEAFTAFWAGRELLHRTTGPLSEAELSELRGHRDAAVLAWERALGATMVHYINEVLVDMSRFDTPDYVYADHAKRWSELKGFALSPQFNPRSPLAADFATLHELLGTAPALPGQEAAAVEAYRVDLLQARALLAEAYGFDPQDLGDDAGLGGW